MVRWKVRGVIRVVGEGELGRQKTEDRRRTKEDRRQMADKEKISNAEQGMSNNEVQWMGDRRQIENKHEMRSTKSATGGQDTKQIQMNEMRNSKQALIYMNFFRH